MGEIKVFGTSNEALDRARMARKMLDAALPNRANALEQAPVEPVLPCGHSASQAQWLGCTETACRPGDAALSEAYARERALHERMGR